MGGRQMPGPTLVCLHGAPGTGKSTIAEQVALWNSGAVLSWDWAMGALTWCQPVQGALRTLDRDTRRRVGWSVLWNLAEAQLRLGRFAVLDGVARAGEVAESRELARRLGARCVVVLTACEDRTVLRDRIEGRDRSIPGWHELMWQSVEAFLERWVPPEAPDLRVDTSADPDTATFVERIVMLGSD